MDHFFDGESLESPCRECDKPYEMPDERHDFGKVFGIRDGELTIWPYTIADYRHEEAELHASS